MSMPDQPSLRIKSIDGMHACGLSLAKSLYKKPLTIVFEGELGAGKTTFIKGFAEGLGITQIVTSPSFALEQVYDSVLSHIDLYRLTPAQATMFMQTLDEFPGIRVIEWGGRDATLQYDIRVVITEVANQERRIDCTFRDIDIPSDEDIGMWIQEVRLPTHIVKHMDAVTTVADRMSDYVLSLGRIVRKNAIHASAKAHDLLRNVDFKTWEGDSFYTPTEEERLVWKKVKDQYGQPHEHAAQKFMQAKGYPEIGHIISTHRGSCDDPRGAENTWSTEQMIVAYADKRVVFENPVTLDARFDDLCTRYGNGTENAERVAWRKTMHDIERWLWNGTPKF